MLCSCLQIQCLKTAVPAILHHCQQCSRTAAWTLPMPAAGVLVNIPSWGSHCSAAARQPCEPVHAQGAAPRMELKHICNPGSSMLEFQQSFTVPLQIGVGNGLCTVATQESVLYSQVNQVLGRTGVSYYRAKAAFSVSFIFGGFARWISTHIFPHRSLQLSSKALYLSKNPIDVQRNFTCRELSGFWILFFLDLFMLLYLLLFENVHDRNTVYKKYIFFSLERFSSDK